MKCDSCKKEMGNKAGENLVALSITATGGGNFSDAFVQKQLGKYKRNKPYSVCFECWLKSLGVKP